MTETQEQYQPDANDVLMGGGHPSVKFNTLRTWFGGTIVAKPTTRQETEFGTGKPKVYPKSGDPIMGILVDVQTDERTDAEDNGVRRMYIEGKRLKDAVRTAVQNSGAAGLEIGGQLFGAWIGEEQGQGATPAKVYEARYFPPTTPVPTATNGQAMPDPRQAATPAPMTDPRAGANEFAPLSNAGPAPTFAQQQPDPQPQAAPPAPMGDPRAPSGVQAAPTAQNGAQSAAPTGAEPTAEAIAALKAAGLDPVQVFPNYRG